jgi:hypothetical protein
MMNDLPDFLTMAGWQGSDSDHPVGAGTPAYRVVYKTLKVYLPASKLEWPNLLVRTGQGRVDRGGVKLCQAVRLRRKHQWLIPQFGDFDIADGTLEFNPNDAVNFEFHAWQEHVDGVVFVEFILQTTESGAANGGGTAEVGLPQDANRVVPRLTRSGSGPDGGTWRGICRRPLQSEPSVGSGWNGVADEPDGCH